MARHRIKFVKGHCGWDVVTLVPEGQVPVEEELAASLKILSAPIDGGLEVGWVGAGERAGELRLRMVGATTKTWISMCGGLSQVLGKALVETSLGAHLGIEVTEPAQIVTLVTQAGPIPVRIGLKGDTVDRITTTMDSYLEYLYRAGVEALTFHGVPIRRVGAYAVIDVRVLERVHPAADFTHRSFGKDLDIVHEVLRAFGRHMGRAAVSGILYDDRAEGPGHFRVFPRFYSSELTAARLPWEFQCGTGSVALAIALAEDGRLPSLPDGAEVVLEWGSYRATRDPYGIRVSRLQLERTGRRLARCSFSHSIVEILAEGELILPAYAQ